MKVTRRGDKKPIKKLMGGGMMYKKGGKTKSKMKKVADVTDNIKIMKEMAKVVDKQNKNDTRYINMSDDFERSRAFRTACDLIFKGKEQPSGYTEPLLHLNRLRRKINQN